MTLRIDTYLKAAVEGEVARVLNAPEHGSHRELLKAATALGSIVAGGALDGAQVESLLAQAARDRHVPEREIARTIRDGFKYGAHRPRQLPTCGFLAQPYRPQASPTVSSPTPSIQYKRPPLAEILDLWDHCIPVTQDILACALLKNRRIDPEQVVLWDLARALPCRRLPNWASMSASASWFDSDHRLIFRLWDHHGQHVSLRARSIHPNAEPKSIPPRGFETGGLILADSQAVKVLRGETSPGWPLVFIVSEGEPDWLNWAHWQSDGNEDAPAHIGVSAGSWKEEFADRIPSGSVIIIRIHRDTAGQDYAGKIRRSLSGKCEIHQLLP